MIHALMRRVKPGTASWLACALAMTACGSSEKHENQRTGSDVRIALLVQEELILGSSQDAAQAQPGGEPLPVTIDDAPPADDETPIGHEGGIDEPIGEPGQEPILEDPPSEVPTPEDPTSEEPSSEEPIVEGPVGEPNPAELAACSRRFGGATVRTMIAGREQQRTVNLVPGEVLALKIAGHRSRVSITVGGAAQAPGAIALCLFVTGHEAQVDVTADDPGRLSLFYWARGDESRTSVVAKRPEAVASVVADMNGHAPRLEVRGVAADVCRDESKAQKGAHAASMVCGP